MTKHSPIFETETAPDCAMAACLGAEDGLRFTFDGADRRDGLIARVTPGGGYATTTMAEFQDSLCGVTPQTMVLTGTGRRRACDVRAGDLLQSASGQLSCVASVVRYDFGWQALGINPLLQPVRVPCGAFGSGQSVEDILVAPGQRLQLDPDADSPVIPALALLRQGIASRGLQTAVTYLSFVLADGRFVLLPTT